MLIDSSRLYPVTLIFVKPFYRRNFHRHGILVKAEIPELLTSTTRTLNVPKTLDPEKVKTSCIFQKVIGQILPGKYPDSLLNNSVELAKALNRDLSGKIYRARLKQSKDGNYIDLEELLLIEEAA